MATGLLIRDFFKEYRELRYSNSGSIALSEIEHNAYRASLTLEITHIDAPRYGSLKTLPENTHYGYVTLFRGSTVTETIPIKYPKFRVFDIRNQGIWNYHQHTESLQLGAGVSVISANASGRGILGRLGELASGSICFVVGIAAATAGPEPSSDFILDFFDCDDSGGDDKDITRRYRGFPIATPFPDIAKFKADVPVSFLWRLETWYLVNPAVYITDNPTDTGDETEGEDQYPVPEQGDGDGDGDEFPESSPIPDSADDRDFDGSNIPPLPPPFEGGQCEGVLYRVSVRIETRVSPPSSTVSYDVVGPVRGIRSASSSINDNPIRQYFLRHGNPETEVNIGGFFLQICSGFPPVCEDNDPNVSILGVQRLDGLPDNCGNPPPIVP